MGWNDEKQIRDEITFIHRKLYELGFSVANDGNTSVKMNPQTIFITPTGLDKAKLKPSQISVIDAKGISQRGDYSPSTEYRVHLRLYEKRPDIRAIIHAHPPHAIALTLSGATLQEPILPEVIIAIGEIPTVPYATPGSHEAAESLSEAMLNTDAAIMERHGSVTCGKTLDEAMQKLERLEHSAKIISIAKAMGTLSPLPSNEVERLLSIGGRTIRPKAPPHALSTYDLDPHLIEMIAEQVHSMLKGKRS